MLVYIEWIKDIEDAFRTKMYLYMHPLRSENYQSLMIIALNHYNQNFFRFMICNSIIVTLVTQLEINKKILKFYQIINWHLDCSTL